MSFWKVLTSVALGPVTVLASKVGTPALIGIAAGSAVDSVIDNVFKDKVKSPILGSILYCDLPIGEHSGIYVGANKIIHLDGNGEIRKVSTQVFLNRLGGLNTAMSIYVSCNEKNPVGSDESAARAESMLGEKRDYHVIFDNCHQFTAGCLTGRFENGVNFLTLLKSEALNSIDANCWRVWDL